jgi:ribonuclease HI
VRINHPGRNRLLEEGVCTNQGGHRNLSEPLLGTRQTNQRAELTALKRALDICPLNRNTEIFSDSDYSIKCVRDWYKNWQKNGWVTSSRKPVENRDLIEEIRKSIDERDAAGVLTNFKWIKGHADDVGNTAADFLAVQGAETARRLMLANGGVIGGGALADDNGVE